MPQHILKIKVVVRSSKARITEESDDCFKVWLTASPTNNQANRQLVKLLAEYFKLPLSSVSIIKGLTSKNKLVKID